MGRGKEWSKTESLHLAQAWVAMSEGDGAVRVKVVKKGLY